MVHEFSGPVPEPEAATPKVDLMIGVNPAPPEQDGKITYDKIGVVAQNVEKYFMILVTEKPVPTKHGVSEVRCDIKHNGVTYEDMKMFFQAHYGFMEKVELQERKDRGKEIVTPGSQEFNFARRFLNNNKRNRGKGRR